MLSAFVIVSCFILQQARQVHDMITLIVLVHETETQGDQEAHPQAPSSCPLSTNTLSSLCPDPIPFKSFYNKRALNRSGEGPSTGPPPLQQLLALAHTRSHTICTWSASSSHQTSITCPDLVQGTPEQPFFTLGLRSPHCRIRSPFQTYRGLPLSLPPSGKG